LASGARLNSRRAFSAANPTPNPSEGNTLTPPIETQEDTLEESLATGGPNAAEPAHETAAPQAHDHEGHNHAAHDHTAHVPAAPALNPELVRSIAVEAPAEEVDSAFRLVTKKYTKLAHIPGFRSGKVPPSLIKSRFAKELRQEVLESLVSEKFRHALREQKLQPVSEPQLSELFLVEGQPLRFKATFEVLPEFSIDGYDTVKVERPDVTVSEEEFESELNSVLDHHATVEPVEEDRPLVDGDWAEIGFSGKLQSLAQTVGEEGLEKVPEPPITGEDVLIEIGGKNTLQAFNEALRGAKVGQELSFEASYPAEFGEARLAGKTVDYDVTVKAIKTKTFPERDEEFAKQLGPYSDWADFETRLRERLAGRKKDALEARARDIMLDELVAKYTFPVPETFVQQQIDARLERGLRALAQQGMSSDAMRQLDFGRLREAQRDQAVSEVKVSLLLDRIAAREGITVSDDDLERELLMLSIQSREPVDALRKRLSEDGSLERIREQLRREKTGAALFEKLAA
jgi:trigger factor